METINHLYTQLMFLLVIEVGLLFTPLLFIGLDFWAGIRKAHKRGVEIRSNKMKRTIDKVARYYNAILAMVIVDVMQISTIVFLHVFCGWTAFTFPFLTLIAVGFVAAIETKSIVEPADAKERRDMAEVTALAKAITAHKDDPKEIAEAIASYLSENTNELNKKEER